MMARPPGNPVPASVSELVSVIQRRFRQGRLDLPLVLWHHNGKRMAKMLGLRIPSAKRLYTLNLARHSVRRHCPWVEMDAVSGGASLEECLDAMDMPREVFDSLEAPLNEGREAAEGKTKTGRRRQRVKARKAARAAAEDTA
jgi:hypothetical protein